jgi:hypothetical protein
MRRVPSRKGGEAAKLLPESDDRSRRLLRFELELGDVLYAALGYVTGEGSAAYQRAIAMSGKLGEPDRRSERSTGFSAPISVRASLARPSQPAMN